MLCPVALSGGFVRVACPVVCPVVAGRPPHRLGHPAERPRSATTTTRAGSSDTASTPVTLPSDPVPNRWPRRRHQTVSPVPEASPASADGDVQRKVVRSPTDAPVIDDPAAGSPRPHEFRWSAGPVRDDARAASHNDLT